MHQIQEVILSNLIYNEEYGRKVFPFLKEEYFETKGDKIVFNVISEYINKYNKFPAKQAILIELNNLKIDQNAFNETQLIVEKLSDNKSDLEWLLDQTEKYCQERAVYNAVMQSIIILDGKDKKLSKGSIPELLSTALSVSFDTSIGHNFFEDSDDRYEYYHEKTSRIPFRLEYLNKITKGGLPAKTLNIIMGGTGVGKTLIMCDLAAGNLLLGKNVLYITMEMAEEEIAKRIDANILDLSLDELLEIPKESYQKKIERAKGKTSGKLIVKEYPTSGASAANFRHLINELRLKKNFFPDIIYIDYINICASSRLKMTGDTYIFVKSIAEELRGLAVEMQVPIVSATQTNRDGYDNSDPSMKNTAESFGLPATCDMMFVVIRNEELDNLNQMAIKQLKNRYSDLNLCRKFIIGVDRSKMKLFNVEESAQTLIDDSPPVMDKSSFGERDRQYTSTKKKFSMNDFEDFAA